jgi:GH18 family chitinase
MGYYVGWEANDVASLPWNDLTQLDLFSVMPCSPDAGSGGDTTYPAGGCTADETRIDVSQHGMSSVNSSWVSTVHAHGKQAFIVIGGTPGSYAAGGVVDWYYPCQNSTVAASFARNLVNYAQANGYDGIDLDEEQDANTAGNGGTPEFTTAMFDTCLQDLHDDIAATTTTQGHTMQFTGYLDPPIDWDLGTDMMTACSGGPCVEWFDSGGYGDTCASNCASFARDVSNEETHEGIPADKIVLGLATQDVSGAQTANANLGTTSATESGTISSISVSALSAAIPAGKIVLASTENPPAHYQILETSGASSGATSIPVTGYCSNATTCTSGSAPLPSSFASGSYVQNDYRGMYDCGNAAGYAAAQGLKGVMVWTAQSDAADYNGTFACFNQISPYANP